MASGGKRANAGRKKGQVDKKTKLLRGLISDKDVSLALTCLRNAIKDNKSVDAAKYLIDQRFGKPRQSVDIEGGLGVTIIRDDI